MPSPMVHSYPAGLLSLTEPERLLPAHPRSVGEPAQGEADCLPLPVYVCGLFCCPGRCPMPVCAIDPVERSGPLHRVMV